MFNPTLEKKSVLAKAGAELRRSAFEVIEDGGGDMQNKEYFVPASFYSINGPAQQLRASTSVIGSVSPTNVPRKLVHLCLGVLGQHLEDILGHITEISAILPRNIKMAMVAIARRRKLLDDEILIALLDDSWVNLDISGSDVTDIGLSKAAQTCPNLHAVDIGKCKNITAVGVSALVSQCHSLEILRLGGCPNSESTARKCLSILVPKLNALEEESWENLDNTDLVDGAQSLRFLMWANIDPDSKARLAAECPRIAVNPWPSPLSLVRVQVPPGACPGTPLDEPYVAGINPGTWAMHASSSYPVDRVGIGGGTINKDQQGQGPELQQLSLAEKFRLAFIERDQRLAPKRAKNIRQHQRRAEKEWATGSSEAKSIALASKFRMSLKH